MIKYLIVLVIVLDIYTLIDCAMTPQDKVRRFPKWAWLLIIIAWFIAGRPRRPRPNRGGRGRIIPPDDDPDFLRKL